MSAAASSYISFGGVRSSEVVPMQWEPAGAPCTCLKCKEEGYGSCHHHEPQYSEYEAPYNEYEYNDEREYIQCALDEIASELSTMRTCMEALHEQADYNPQPTCTCVYKKRTGCLAQTTKGHQCLRQAYGGTLCTLHANMVVVSKLSPMYWDNSRCLLHKEW